MANNKRISEITKELTSEGLAITNKDVISFLDSQGIEGKKPMSAVDEDTESRIRKKRRKRISI